MPFRLQGSSVLHQITVNTALLSGNTHLKQIKIRKVRSFGQSTCFMQSLHVKTDCCWLIVLYDRYFIWILYLETLHNTKCTINLRCPYSGTCCAVLVAVNLSDLQLKITTRCPLIITHIWVWKCISHSVQVDCKCNKIPVLIHLLLYSTILSWNGKCIQVYIYKNRLGNAWKVKLWLFSLLVILWH